MPDNSAGFGLNIESSGVDRATASLNNFQQAARGAAGGARETESASARMNRQLEEMIRLQQQMAVAMQGMARSQSDAADAAQRHHRHMVELGAAAGVAYLSYKAIHGVVVEIGREMQRTVSLAENLARLGARAGGAVGTFFGAGGAPPGIPLGQYRDIQNTALSGGLPIDQLLLGRALGVGVGQGTAIGGDTDRLVSQMAANFRDLSEHGRQARQTLRDYGVTATDATSALRQFLIALDGVADGYEKLQAFQTVLSGANPALMRQDVAASLMAVTPGQQYRQAQQIGIAQADAAAIAVQQQREREAATGTRNFFGLGIRDQRNFWWDPTGLLGPIYQYGQEVGQLFDSDSQFFHRNRAFRGRMGQGLGELWRGDFSRGAYNFFGGYGDTFQDLFAQLGIGSHPNLPVAPAQPKAPLSEEEKQQAMILLQHVDPSMRAGVLLQRETEPLAKALERGAITQEEYNKAIAGLTMRFQRLTDPVAYLTGRMTQQANAVAGAPLTAAGQAEAEALFQARLNPWTGELRNLKPGEAEAFHGAFAAQGQRTQAISQASLERQVQELRDLTEAARSGTGAMNEVRAAYQVQEDALKNNSTAQQQQTEKTLLLTQAFGELAEKAAEITRNYSIQAQNSAELAEAARNGPLAVRALQTQQQVGEQFRPAREAAGALSGNWEMQHNNFAGMRIPGIYASPGSGGFQSFATPEQGIAHIENQLLRYYSGATTGRPLTTLQDIISTWAPPRTKQNPHENDTPLLIRRASQWTGFAPGQQLNLHDPMVMTAVVEAMIRNEQGGAPLGKLGLSREQILGISNVMAGGAGEATPSDQIAGMQRQSTSDAMARLRNEALRGERTRTYESSYRTQYDLNLPGGLAGAASAARRAREAGEIPDTNASQHAEFQRQLADAAGQEYQNLKQRNEAQEAGLNLQRQLAEAAAQGPAAEHALQDALRITNEYRDAQVKAIASGNTELQKAVDLEKQRATATAAQQRSLAVETAFGHLNYQNANRVGDLQSSLAALQSGGQGAYQIQQIVNQQIEQMKAQGATLDEIKAHLGDIRSSAEKMVTLQQQIEDTQKARGELASRVNSLIDTTKSTAMDLLFPSGRTGIERKIARDEALKRFGGQIIGAGVETFALDPLKQMVDSAITGKPNTGINAGSVAGGMLGKLFGFGGSDDTGLKGAAADLKDAAAALKGAAGGGIGGGDVLSGGYSPMASTGGGIGGLFKNLLGGSNSLIGKWLFGGGGGGAGTAWDASGNVVDAGSSLAVDFAAGHTGWYVGMEAPPQRIRANSSIFLNAPRYHAGLAPDEVPTILQKGEVVLSRAQVAAGQTGAGSSTFIHAPVNVYAQDTNSFRATSGQIGAAHQRQVERGQRYT